MKRILARVALFALLPVVISAGSEEKKWISDPSAEALPIENLGSIIRGERYRVLGDFNGDGKDDIALSEPTPLGTGGGTFVLYLGDGKGKYRELGVFSGNVGAVAIEKRWKVNRIWTYSHCSGSEGEIGYWEITEKGISEYHHLTIFPGDAGTEMGRAIQSAVFDHSDVKLKIERSKTRDGKVQWKPEQ